MSIMARINKLEINENGVFVDGVKMENVIRVTFSAHAEDDGLHHAYIEMLADVLIVERTTDLNIERRNLAP